MTLRLRVASRSEVGLIRKNNQDSGYASPRLLVVADGMGGAAAGDLASAVAIDAVRHLDAPDSEQPAGIAAEAADDRTSAAAQGAAGLNPLLARFADAIAQANDRIADLVAADYSLEGMGTTVTGAVFDGQWIGLAHIGDSRAYLLRDGRLERLTHDHSWVQSLVDDGKISAAEAAYHPHRSLLLKVLNGQPANEPDLTSLELRAGDRLLFCSDGLCGLVDDDRIAELAAAVDLDAAVTGLVDAALAAGGIDNITVILAEAIEDGSASATTPPSGAAGADLEAVDTAVRPAAAAVLGAAAERGGIPSSVTRAGGPVPAPTPADDDGEQDEDDEEDGAPRDQAVETAAARRPGGPPADDESRYAPRPPDRRRLVRTLLIGLAVLLIAAAGLGAGYAWTRTQYFVGAAGDQVAIYQGLPDGIPGLPLSSVYEVQELPVRSLPPYYQAQVVAGIEVSSLDAARATVEMLTETARRCAQPSAGPTPSPSTSGAPKPTPTPTRTGPRAPTATATATGTGTATATARATASASVPPTAAATPSATTTPLPGRDC
jgi:serine/threonine protein phosphatase PrpC